MGENNTTTTPTQKKIIDAMDKVYEKLIDLKKKTNSDLVVMQDGKIVRIKASFL
ncbi:hypothetical protein BC749_1246 [Flavobacterium araucananum]|uniref:hypothetical protein n=1 Tax=Flavobacterium araucananum TaxID=946678 RepID=UPI000D7A9B12|nr:hypothetical protein [Flavobacterium araucananum]PWJ89259.1 hypothetical protein BC749_1246 [Flavobacterium araucananum]